MSKTCTFCDGTGKKQWEPGESIYHFSGSVTTCPICDGRGSVKKSLKAEEELLILEKEERLISLLDDLDSGDIPDFSDISEKEAELEIESLKKQLKILRGSG